MIQWTYTGANHSQQPDDHAVARREGQKRQPKGSEAVAYEAATHFHLKTQHLTMMPDSKIGANLSLALPDNGSRMVAQRSGTREAGY